MDEFEWFKRLPDLADDIGDYRLDSDDDTEEGYEHHAQTADLADLFIYIEYTNAGGVSKRRPITIKRETEANGQPSIFAFCHARKALRQFRLDRISTIITVDGEVFDPASSFWQHIGYRTGAETQASLPTADDRYAATALKRRFNNELVVLAALSGADGNLHRREIDVIVDYIERELEWERVAIDPLEADALRNHVRRMRITRERLQESVEQLLVVSGKHRLYSKQLDRFFVAAKQVAVADNRIHAAEVEFVEYLARTVASHR